MAESTISQTFSDTQSTRKMSVWRELGILTMIISEITLLAPWIQVFQYRNQPSMVWLIIVLTGVSMAAMAVRRLLKSTRASLPLIQLLTFVVLPAAILLVVHLMIYQEAAFGRLTIIRIGRAFAGLIHGLPIEVSLIVLTIYAWARGVRAAARGMTDLTRTGGLIRIGLFSFLVLLLITGENSDSMRWLVTLYFFSSLLAIALSRTDLIARSHLQFKLPLHSGWLRGILVLTFATVLLGILGGLLLQTETAAGIANLFSGLLRFGVRVLELVLSPVIYFFGLLFSLLLRWLSPAINEENMISPEDGGESDFEGMPFGDNMLGQEGTLSPEFVTGLSVIVIVLVAVLVMWGIKQRSLNGNNGDVDVESLEDSESLIKGLQRFYQQIRDRIDSISSRDAIRRFLVESSIRRIYSQLLRYGERFGVKRVKSETPFEFQRRLLRVAPHLAEDVRLITHAYVEIRYGEFPEDPDAIKAVRMAWENVKAFR